VDTQLPPHTPAVTPVLDTGVHETAQ